MSIFFYLICSAVKIPEQVISISKLRQNNVLGVTALIYSVAQIQGMVMVSKQLATLPYMRDFTGSVAVFDLSFDTD